MKKIFAMFILFVLTACPGPVFPIIIKNMYYDEVYIYSPIYNEYLAKDDIFNGYYSTNLTPQERKNDIYYIYKDKDKKELVTSFSQEDLKIGKGHSILSFNENGIFEVENSSKIFEFKTYSRNQICRRKKNMLDYHRKNTSQLQSNIYSLYINNTAKSVFNDTKFYVKEIKKIYVGNVVIDKGKVQFIFDINKDVEEHQKALQNYFDTLTNDILISECDIKIDNENDFKSLLFSNLIIKFSVLMENR